MKVLNRSPMNGNTTQFQYDLQARLIEKSYPSGASQQIVYESCSGRVASVTDALGESKSYTYFLDNQLKSIDYSDPDTSDVFITNDTFLPRPLTMSDGDGFTVMTYTPVGSSGALQLASISSPFGDLATFTYDVAGRTVARTINGSQETVSYDQLWRPTTMTNALDTFQMAYLGNTRQVTSLSSLQGPSLEYGYGTNLQDRRLIQIKNLRNNGDPLSQFDYTHDAVGQITQLVQSFNSAGGGGDDGGDDDDDQCRKKCKRKCKKCHRCWKWKKRCRCEKKPPKRCCYKKRCKHKYRYKKLVWRINQVLRKIWGFQDVIDEKDCESDDDTDGGNGGGSTNLTETWDFNYDNLSQLVGANLNQNSYADYTFDPAGNLTNVTVNGVTTALTYNNLNQVTSPGNTSFDNKGQTISQDDEGRSFEWDARGQVTAIVQGNRRSEFGYDGLGRRTTITEIVDGVEESKKHYFWLGGRIVIERDGQQTGFPITKRYYGQGVLNGTDKQYYTTDHLGSVRELIDENGDIIAEYRYSIYGERTKVAGEGNSDFGFAGLFHHEPSGLDLATYRLYDAKQRRFISRDPLGESVDYNLYRYANNNPVNYTDADGLKPRVIRRQRMLTPIDGVSATPMGQNVEVWFSGLVDAQDGDALQNPTKSSMEVKVEVTNTMPFPVDVKCDAWVTTGRTRGGRRSVNTDIDIREDRARSTSSSASTEKRGRIRGHGDANMRLEPGESDFVRIRDLQLKGQVWWGDVDVTVRVQATGGRDAANGILYTSGSWKKTVNLPRPSGR